MERVGGMLRALAEGEMESDAGAPVPPPAADGDMGGRLALPLVWSESQRRVVELVLSGVNVFMTGPGGVGKSAVIRHLVRELRQRADQERGGVGGVGWATKTARTHYLHVVAPTGCAAIVVGEGATTYHRWAGITPMVSANANWRQQVLFADPALRAWAQVPEHDLPPETLAEVRLRLAAARLDVWNGAVDRLRRNHTTLARWKATQVLIMDEASMLSLHDFEFLDYAGRVLRGCPDRAFGGIQLLFSGDFLQLEPVRAESCFTSELWFRTFAPDHQVEMTSIFRQSDPRFQRVLNEVREGVASEETCRVLYEHVRPLPAEWVGKVPELFPVNSAVHSRNKYELAQLPGEGRVYVAQVVDDVDALNPRDVARRMQQPEWLVEAEKKHLLTRAVEEEVTIKVGARVMSLVNYNDMITGRVLVCNGSTGTVTQFVCREELRASATASAASPAWLPVVEFDNGETMTVSMHAQCSDLVPGLRMTFLPLTLAWAISIHKSQGITLDRAKINVGQSVFAAGQTYVALSRVRSLEGLFIEQLNLERVRVNLLARGYYRRLRDHHAGVARIEVPARWPIWVQILQPASAGARVGARASAGAGARERRVTAAGEAAMKRAAEETVEGVGAGTGSGAGRAARARGVVRSRGARESSGAAAPMPVDWTRPVGTPGGALANPFEAFVYRGAAPAPP